MFTYKNIILVLAGLMALCMLQAQPGAETKPFTEKDYYSIITLPIPEGIELEVGGLATLPNGNIAAATRRGEVWIVENPYMDGRSQPFYRKYASGLHEILGLKYYQGNLVLAQRGELTRLLDKNGDGQADYFEAMYNWPISGHYHEYSYGPAIAPDGSLFVTGNVAFGDVEWWRGESRVPWRGWTMKISEDGEMEPWATGMRSPCGLGFIDGEFFYSDNQGDWIGSGSLVHVEKGDFTGHPAGLKWADRPESPVKLTTEALYATVDPRFTPRGQTPIKPENIEEEVPLPLFDVAEKHPAVKTPAVWLPHSVLGISTSDFLVDTTGGAFGPFEGQVFVGDQGQSKIVRVFLEKVNGTYQGAAFGFVEGFRSGVLRLSWGHDGSLFVGQTNRGWGSTGKRSDGLQRLVWSGKMPFEMKAVRAMPDGFEIEFTQPVNKRTASNPDSYQITGFIYKYHPVYGSPIVNDKINPIRGVVVSKDGLKARIVVDSLRLKYIHEIQALGVRNYYDEAPLLHNTAYYTLNEIPEGEKLNLPPRPVAKPKMQHAHASQVKTAPKTETPDAKAAPTPLKPKPKPVALAKRQLRRPTNWARGAERSIVVGTQPGLKFDKTEITVKAGAKLKWTFTNNDDMPHNLVIVRPGEADAVGDLAIKMGLKGVNKGYIPATAKILNHTRLLEPGNSESIYLVAPSTPGNYMFVCTVPGHAFLMRGTLKVLP